MPATATDPTTVVVGAGVIGLSCAMVLAERGHRVRVVAEEIAGGVSAVAAALWAPSHVERSERVRGWAYESLARLRRDSSPEAGVYEQRSRTIAVAPFEQDPWMSGFTAVVGATDPLELPDGYRAGRDGSILLVDTSRYLPWLRDRCRGLGVVFEQRRIDTLAEGEPAEVTVLAAGMGSAELAEDASLRPVRSQIVRLENPGLTRTLLVRDGPLAPLFVVPRTDDVVVGGPAEDGRWDQTIDPALEADMLRRARAAEPALGGARVVGRAVGHRPVRESIRVERGSTRGPCRRALLRPRRCRVRVVVGHGTGRGRACGGGVGRGAGALVSGQHVIAPSISGERIRMPPS